MVGYKNALYSFERPQYSIPGRAKGASLLLQAFRECREGYIEAAHRRKKISTRKWEGIEVIDAVRAAHERESGGYSPARR